MKRYSGKKLLVLGGKPIGSCDFVSYAKSLGAYVIVADYLPVEQSPAKSIADEAWNCSTADVDELARRCIADNVDGVVTGIHEFNIKKCIELCKRINKPYYCDRAQWDLLDNKRLFKQVCRKYDIPVSIDYSNVDDVAFPVIVKPTDSSGSRGFSICHDRGDLAIGIEKALAASDEKDYLIEEFVDSCACIVHYTVVNGDVSFTGMSDKVSLPLPDGSMVMAIQKFPSRVVDRYISELNGKVIEMIRGCGIKNGPIWFEVFNDEKSGRLLFNEAGLRFGGSMSNNVVGYYYDVNQIGVIIDCALNIPESPPKIVGRKVSVPNYCILPMHLRPGIIDDVLGMKDASAVEGVQAIVPVHYKGDVIENWGTTRQVYCYLHIAYSDVVDLRTKIDSVKNRLIVRDDHSENLLYSLFDISNLEKACL